MSSIWHKLGGHITDEQLMIIENVFYEAMSLINVELEYAGTDCVRPYLEAKQNIEKELWLRVKPQMLSENEWNSMRDLTDWIRRKHNEEALQVLDMAFDEARALMYEVQMRYMDEGKKEEAKCIDRLVEELEKLRDSVLREAGYRPRPEYYLGSYHY